MKYRLALAAAILMLIAPVVWADSLDVVSGTTTWTPFETPGTFHVGDGPARAFWNNWSKDTTNDCNIGYWLAGTGGCGGSFQATSPKITPSYLNDPTTGFKLTKAPETTSVTVTEQLQVTGWQNEDAFGWVDLTTATPTLHQLFQGSNLVGASQTFVPSGSYGFYLTAPAGDKNSPLTYLSTGVGDTGRTHFAVFQLDANGHYMIGTDDEMTGSDRDFQDNVFKVSLNTAPVPEPASMVLLGTGLVGLAAALRRRRRA